LCVLNSYLLPIGEDRYHRIQPFIVHCPTLRDPDHSSNTLHSVLLFTFCILTPFQPPPPTLASLALLFPLLLCCSLVPLAIHSPPHSTSSPSFCSVAHPWPHCRLLLLCLLSLLLPPITHFDPTCHWAPHILHLHSSFLINCLPFFYKQFLGAVSCGPRIYENLKRVDRERLRLLGGGEWLSHVPYCPIPVVSKLLLATTPSIIHQQEIKDLLPHILGQTL
jgi:hypothetical protein